MFQILLLLLPSLLTRRRMNLKKVILHFTQKSDKDIYENPAPKIPSITVNKYFAGQSWIKRISQLPDKKLILLEFDIQRCIRKGGITSRRHVPT